MTSVTIAVDDRDLLDKLALFEHRLENLQPMLESIGGLVQASILLNFKGQHSPEGEPWEPLKPSTLARRRGSSAQILRDTGRLNRSITYNTSDYAVEIGTDVEYANLQHFGGDIERSERQHTLYFRVNRDGEVGHRFVKKGKSNFAQTVTIAAHTVTVPARPFVGLSTADHRDILDLLGRYLDDSVA